MSVTLISPIHFAYPERKLYGPHTCSIHPKRESSEQWSLYLFIIYLARPSLLAYKNIPIRILIYYLYHV